MSNQYRTYMKREIKKTYPLLIIGVLFWIFMGIIVTSITSENYENVLIQMSGHDTYQGFWYVGMCTNIFLKVLFGSGITPYYTLAIFVFLVILLQRTFLHENRSEIADFLQVLPLRERDKVIMKLLNAHVAIAIYSISFGIIMSLFCLSANADLQKVTQLYCKTYTEYNSYAMIWQSVILQFLGISAMYLVFFLTITCIHNRFLSYAIGCGLLISPVAFCTWFVDIFRQRKESVLTLRYFVPGYFFPDSIYVDTASGNSYSNINWDGYGEHVGFYIGIIVVALALIVLAVSRKWHIREAHNVLMNEEVAAQFVITGISFCAALFGAAFVVEFTFYDGQYSSPAYWGISIILCIISYVILSAIRRLIEKRQQGM
ncbi:MAG: hypothetical protein ACI4SQ_00585 [Eubacterium sp.]